MIPILSKPLLISHGNLHKGHCTLHKTLTKIKEHKGSLIRCNILEKVHLEILTKISDFSDISLYSQNFCISGQKYYTWLESCQSQFPRHLINFFDLDYFLLSLKVSASQLWQSSFGRVSKILQKSHHLIGVIRTAQATRAVYITWLLF